MILSPFLHNILWPFRLEHTQNYTCSFTDFSIHHTHAIMKLNLSFLLVLSTALGGAFANAIPDNAMLPRCVKEVPAGGDPAKVCQIMLLFSSHVKECWSLLIVMSNIVSCSTTYAHEIPLTTSLPRLLLLELLLKSPQAAARHRHLKKLLLSVVVLVSSKFRLVLTQPK